jgi:hypothetical protein
MPRHSHVSNSWLDAHEPYFDEHPYQKRRIMRGVPIDEAIRGYSAKRDPYRRLLAKRARPDFYNLVQVLFLSLRSI